ncbi:hypothetical protein SAMN04488518_104355 [Pseudovibrio ascidiaceicola]|uniref:Uncharacterized protein n=1 Tax=Pseudovibrio ascidiaceicola TaxID=285279 RepID=A0A1I3Z132_9HYPH|nr:hypothetical protein [Pseudovibrio ascidiaceicola]SFK37788.1 hypothetical protein SAMN04488518_104355 [Pseudovibrio ascidiaceicola]
MARQTVPFKQADVVRAYKAAEKVGIAPEQLRVTIRPETQEIIMEPLKQEANDNRPNPWDDLL